MLIKIHKAIVDKLRAELKGTEFEKTPIIPRDLSEGFSRPAIKIDIESSNLSNESYNYYGRNISIEIHFFASDINKYKIENMKVQELIEQAFIDGIRIDEKCFVNIEEIECVTSDTVLIATFDFNIMFDKPKVVRERNEGEFMEDLELELERG